MNDNSSILDDLLLNKEHYRALVEPLNQKIDQLLVSENKVFKDDIMAQFQETTRWIFAKDIHKRFNIDIDEAYILLENINIRSYLK
jgi:hypothetical protein